VIAVEIGAGPEAFLLVVRVAPASLPEPVMAAPERPPPT
jgi:hypothetical protein